MLQHEREFGGIKMHLSPYRGAAGWGSNALTYIPMFERGKIHPSLEGFVRIATALDNSPIRILKSTLEI